jgi:hypothetical protein
MAKYRESLRLLLLSKGVSDILSTDFKEIDLNTSRTKLNFRLVLGNISLILKRYKTPKEADGIIEDFLQEPIPFLQ